MKKTKRVWVAVCAMIAAAMPGLAQPSKTPLGPTIGMETREKAPSFRLKDQFGHEQSNETLRGTNGTVLLFFRSADW